MSCRVCDSPLMFQAAQALFDGAPYEDIIAEIPELQGSSARPSTEDKKQRSGHTQFMYVLALNLHNLLGCSLLV